MLTFDILAVIAALTLNYFTSKDAAFVITFQICAQVLFSIVFVFGGVHEYVDNHWFYLIKGYILFVTILLLYEYKAKFWILFTFIIGMAYSYGMWFEEIVNEYGVFNAYFMPFMISFTLLQLIYIFGVTNVGLSFGVQFRNMYWRFINNVFDYWLRLYANEDKREKAWPPR